MKISYSILVLAALSLFAVGVVYGQDDVKKFPSCKLCRMDREKFSYSRMLIEYEDGTTVGVCSLYCAAVEMKQSKGKQIKSLMVADYTTKKLVDAKTAIWLVGGRKQGVMTSLPKWAFAKEEDARKFIEENGGQLTPFDRVMKVASEEAAENGEKTHDHQGHAGYDMGPGAQMRYNPGFGDQIYQTHPAGMWMINFKYMHMDMDGLRDDTKNVSRSEVGFNRGLPYNYMMIPTSMTMDMYMPMVMYGITDHITVMAMGNYQVNKMNMLMDMGPMMGISKEGPMRTAGFGDTELRGMYKINKYLVGSLGISFPTGSITEEFETMHKTFRAPYDMQLGSGTFDLKPALTYSGFSNDGNWNWGAQAQYTWHTAKNRNDWAFGDNVKLISWVQRAFGPITTWARLAFNYTGRIRGEDSEISKLNQLTMGMGAPMPDADPRNYGGTRLDGLIGVSFTKGPFSLGVEGGIPFYQNLHGLQLKTDWITNAGVQVMF